MGEATSDYLVHVLVPVLAVLLGFVAFVLALVLQLGRRRYVPWAYWLAVVMVGTFGTMAADVVHVALGVPYAVSSAFYALVLAGVFVVWARTEHTLSIHTVDTPRRELFYWAAVVATFAMGTAVGDFAATTMRLGYLGVRGRLRRAHHGARRWATASGTGTRSWLSGTAYVLTRPLGASVADWLGKPRHDGGLGWGRRAGQRSSWRLADRWCSSATSRSREATGPHPRQDRGAEYPSRLAKSRARSARPARATRGVARA